MGWDWDDNSFDPDQGVDHLAELHYYYSQPLKRRNKLTMANEIFYVTGKAGYAKVYEHNRDMEGYMGQYKPFNGVYSIMLGVEDEGDEYDLFMDWNSAFRPKIGGKTKNKKKEIALPEEKGFVKGLAYFTFRRKHQNVYKDRDTGEEKTRENGAPEVWLQKEDGSVEPFEDLIGNGSDVTLKLELYRGKTPDGESYSIVTLLAVRINELVAPPAEVTEAAEARKPIEHLDDGDIPF